MLELPKITTQEDDTEFLKFISSNVKNIRLKKGKSQLETALSIGQKSQGAYACMENNTNNKHFNLVHLFKLSKFFDVDIREFFDKS
ncbi:XRE family transcriptional regulator [Campylobacter mucosalis]|nr:XRE family transcriptional regulator [Campylobacter mucosalis]